MSHDHEEKGFYRNRGSTYGQVPYWVRYDNDLSHLDKLVYCEITANTNGDKTDITNQTLSDYLLPNSDPKYGEKKIGESISRLVEKGYLERSWVGKIRRIHIPVRYTAVINNIKFVKEPKDQKDKNVIEFANKLVSMWNEEYGKRFRVTDKVIKNTKARLQMFDKNEIIQAFKNRFHSVRNNPWYWRPENSTHRLNIDSILRNDNKINHWLNVTREDKFSPKDGLSAIEKEDDSSFIE